MHILPTTPVITKCVHRIGVYTDIIGYLGGDHGIGRKRGKENRYLQYSFFIFPHGQTLSYLSHTLPKLQ